MSAKQDPHSLSFITLKTWIQADKDHDLLMTWIQAYKDHDLLVAESWSFRGKISS